MGYVYPISKLAFFRYSPSWQLDFYKPFLCVVPDGTKVYATIDGELATVGKGKATILLLRGSNLDDSNRVSLWRYAGVTLREGLPRKIKASELLGVAQVDGFSLYLEYTSARVVLPPIPFLVERGAEFPSIAQDTFGIVAGAILGAALAIWLAFGKKKS